MEIRVLKYFIAVAEELNITRAAEKLNISQPPLSNQIKKLEEELDTQLFIRGKRHLELTESGKLLYRYAREILNLTEKSTNEIMMMDKGMNGTIAIGLVEGSAPDIASAWVSSFMKKYPEVRFRIMDGNSDELIDMLRSGLINLAVITSPCDHTLLHRFKVGREYMAAFMSPDNPLAQKEGDTVELCDLKDQPLIVPSREYIINMIYKWFREIDAEPRIVCRMDNYLDVAALSGADCGISIFPRTCCIKNDSIIARNISNPARMVEYLFVWLKGKPLPIADRAFIDHVREQITG